MSNIDKIRQEIERRFAKYDEHYTSAGKELNDLLFFIKDLMKQEQADKVDLEQEVISYFQGMWPDTSTAEGCNTQMSFTPPAILRLARHIAEWQKTKMMEGSVEAKIYGYDDGSFELIASWLDMPKNSIYKDGQKVRIIIVKEDKR